MNTARWRWYEALVGREDWRAVRPGEEPQVKWLGAITFRAPNDDAADSMGRRLAETLFAGPRDCPRAAVFPLAEEG